jgi:hypothetical protein
MSLRSWIMEILKPKNKCGIDGFACKTCARCRRAEDERWNKIWEQKFASQEKDYYRRGISYLRERQSPGQSSLNINWPIDEDVTNILSTPKGVSRRRGRPPGQSGPTTGSRKASSPASRLL